MWVKEEGMSSPGGEGYIWFGHVQNKWLGLLNHVYYGKNVRYLHATVGSYNTDNCISIVSDTNYMNKWVYYAMIYKNGVLKFYINAKLIGEKNMKIDYSDKHAALGRHWWFYDSEERTSARFTGAIDEVKIYKHALTKDELTDKLKIPCKTYLNYSNFNNPDRLIFVDDARKQDSAIRLTSNQIKKRGAVWFDTPVYIDDDFWTEFSFKFTNGNDFNNPDGSEPGADGIAFVIQNQGNYAVGLLGGDIGYSSLHNAVAIEYDTYANDENQIENYFDPNGNHVALQVSHNGVISSKHTKEYNLAINNPQFKFENDVVYYSRIEYNNEQKRIKVYVSKDTVFLLPLINYSPIDLTNYMHSRDNTAYIGFTSATGSSEENHLLLSWKYCSQATPISGINIIEQSDGNTLLSPNPAQDLISVIFDELSEEILKIEVINSIGRKFDLKYILTDNRVNINISELEKGLYFVKIYTKSQILIKKFIKI